MKSVSVVIPVYNNSAFIGNALESALQQSLAPQEIIVIDDGSTDTTAEVVASFGDKVRYMYQENSGSGTARNKGIKLAESPWISFLDADDYWEPDHLEKLLHCTEKNPDARLVYCGKKWVNQDGKLLPDAPVQNDFPEGWIFYPLFGANYISSTSVAMADRQALLDARAFNENPEFRNAQDYDLWLRMAALNPVASVPEYTVFYRRHDSNRTLDSSSRHQGLISALENAYAIHTSGSYDKRNEQGQIVPEQKMRQVYDDAISNGFYTNNYTEMKQFAQRGKKYGPPGKQAQNHLTLGKLPKWFLTFLRRIKNQG